MGVSVIREILKVTEHPEIISFAGGLPAPECFPVEALARAHARVFAEDGAAACQYSTTEGWLPLRHWIAERMRARGVDAAAERVLVTSGSQQGIDLVAKAFLDPGDAVIVENPCYLAALQVFKGYEAELLTVASDDAGMKVEEVERAIACARQRPKLIYVVSQFHNPKGTTLPLERRQRLINISRRFGIPIVEDDPYGELRYAGEPLPPLAALDSGAGLVIYLSTFSKTLSPGMRVGWAHASEEIYQALIPAKQAADLHTNTIQQRAAAHLLEEFDYDAHIRRIREVYGERRRVMLDALEENFPEGVRWTRPEGGLFLWVELREGLNAEDVFDEALRERVAFVPGAPFYAAAPRQNMMRLNFSNSSPEMILEGIGRLGKILKRMS